jgi:hypothetical protein
MALPAPFLVADASDEAFERCGVAPSGITPEHIESLSRSINLLLSAWENDGIDFWKVQTLTHTTTLGESTFTPPDGTIDIIRIGVKRDSYLTPMLIIAADDWFMIPDRDLAQGMPTRLWLQRLRDTNVGNYWPMAENDTDELVYDALVQFDDSTILQGEPDVPRPWLAAFTDGLTYMLARKYDKANLALHSDIYGGPGTAKYPQVSSGSYATARMGNRERGDTVFIKHKSRRMRR